MIITLPVTSKENTSSLYHSFGRAPYFMLFDTDTKEAKYIDNAAMSQHGGAGISAAQMIVDQGSNVVVVPRCGQNAMDVLKGANIEIYEAASGSAMSLIEAYQNKELNLLSSANQGNHKHQGHQRRGRQ